MAPSALGLLRARYQISPSVPRMPASRPQRSRVAHGPTLGPDFLRPAAWAQTIMRAALWLCFRPWPISPAIWELDHAGAARQALRAGALMEAKRLTLCLPAVFILCLLSLPFALYWPFVAARALEDNAPLSPQSVRFRAMPELAMLLSGLPVAFALFPFPLLIPAWNRMRGMKWVSWARRQALAWIPARARQAMGRFEWLLFSGPFILVAGLGVLLLSWLFPLTLWIDAMQASLRAVWRLGASPEAASHKPGPVAAPAEWEQLMAKLFSLVSLPLGGDPAYPRGGPGLWLLASFGACSHPELPISRAAPELRNLLESPVFQRICEIASESPELADPILWRALRLTHRAHVSIKDLTLRAQDSAEVNASFTLARMSAKRGRSALATRLAIKQILAACESPPSQNAVAAIDSARELLQGIEQRAPDAFTRTLHSFHELQARLESMRERRSSMGARPEPSLLWLLSACESAGLRIALPPAFGTKGKPGIRRV